MSRKRKTIQVSDRTYRELAKLGTLEDSFDSVIWRLLEEQKGQGDTTPQQEAHTSIKEGGALE